MKAKKFYTKKIMVGDEPTFHEYFTLDDGKGSVYDGPATEEQKKEYAGEYLKYLNEKKTEELEF